MQTLELEYYQLKGNYTDLSTDYETLELEYYQLEYNYVYLSVFVDRPLESKSTPSLSELDSWLFLDQTNLLGYHNDFDCKDFSVVLSVKARTHHWDMGVVAVYGYDVDTEEDYAHAFNFIVTTDGLVYVEPQTDDVWWYTDYKEIKPGITWEIGEDQWIRVEDVEIVFEGS